MNENITSTDGETPEVVNRIAKHPDKDQIDPETYRVNQSEIDQAVGKTALTAISIRRPAALEFVRVHPDEDYRVSPVYFINLKQSREFYLVDPALKPQLRPREYWIGNLYLATSLSGKPFFWIVKTQSPTGVISDWYNSDIECAERAMEEWVQVVPDIESGSYNVVQAEGQLGEPEWPEQGFKELFELAFKRRRVTTMEHAVFKQLRGRA